MTPEVVGDQHDRHAGSLLQLAQQVQDLGLGRHVQGGGRLVGDQQFRVGRQRHRDHRPLAQAAAELVGVLVHALLGARDAHQPQQLDRRGRCASFLFTRQWSWIASTIWLPMVWTGLNEVIGSWKTSAISPPRIAAHLRGRRLAAARGRPRWPCRRVGWSRIWPSTIRPGRSTIRRIERAVTLLPQPLSPTMPSVLPGRRRSWRRRRP